MKLLTCNVGSSSLRLTVFETCSDSRAERLHASYGVLADARHKLEIVREYGPFDAVGHRIVHGGRFSLYDALALDDEVLREIERVRHLAPDHNAAALKIAAECTALFPGVPQFGVFDSAFHATLPQHAATYPLPAAVTKEYGIRRFGFHGLSHKYSANRVLERIDTRPLRHVSVHAGNGVSATAIVDGISVDTTMGFTPLEGAMMGNRSGSFDPGIIFELRRCGISAERIGTLIDRESGLLGVSGTSNDYARVAESATTVPSCRLALDMYHHRLAGEIARMAASCGGIDVLSFTGGVAEHQPSLRENVCSRLSFLNVRSVFTIESREDEMIAEAIVGLKYTGLPRPASDYQPQPIPRRCP